MLVTQTLALHVRPAAYTELALPYSDCAMNLTYDAIWICKPVFSDLDGHDKIAYDSELFVAFLYRATPNRGFLPLL